MIIIPIKPTITAIHLKIPTFSFNKKIEKINSFFGYKAITDLRLQQNFIPEKKIVRNVDILNQAISEEEKISIKSEIDNIKNKDLEKSIVNLGASIKREDG